MNIIKNKVISFDDIILVPQYSDINTRSAIDTETEVCLQNKKIKFKLPIISSPMSTISEAYMCNAISSAGGLGIIHRYNTIDFQTKLLGFINDSNKKAAAIGVTGDYKERLSALREKGLNIVCIDIAHGDHLMMKDAIEHIKSEHEDLFIIAGNVATKEGYKRLSSWGADAVRTSIGSGSICTTRIQTGHGIPTLQAVIDCYEAKKDILDEGGNPALIIADGGIKNSGDVIKSLAAGADFVMLGSMLSGTKETPGKVILNSEGKKIKRYNGMASKLAQKNWKGSYSSIEGVSSYVPYKGTVLKVVNEIMSNVRSGMSYSGAKNLKELREGAIAVLQTTSSRFEGNAHIFDRK